MQKNINNLTVIIKTTYQCNMRCSYCYEGDKPTNTRIDFSTVRNLINKIVDYVDCGKPIKIIWHGGEPLLMGLNFFQEVVKLQNSFGPAYAFENAIQTNGLLLSDKAIEFFAQNKFRVGISLDGPPEIHDAQRMTISNVSFERVFGSYLRIKNQSSIHQNTKISALAVFTRNTMKHLAEFYNFFSQNQIHVKINPLLFAGNAKKTTNNLQVTPDEYGEALIYLFDQWLSEENFKFTIEPFTAILRSIATGKPTACTFSGNCFDKYLSIDPDGNIIPCGRWSKEEFIYGNINTGTLSSALTSQDVQSFKQRRAGVISVCHGCEHFDICRGGCAYSGFMRNGDLSEPDFYCKSYKMLFIHIKNTLPSYLSPALQNVEANYEPQLV